MSAALKFRQPNLPRQPGEMARLKIVQGPDYGSVFVITSNRITIGRGDDNGVILADLKASRQHAELSYGPEGWVINDRGSANGILYSGKFVRTVNLRSGEVVGIGETTLEFFAATSGTMVLMAPPKQASIVRSEEAAFVQKRAEVRAMGRIGGQKTVATAGKSGGARGMVMIMIAVGVFAFLFLGEEKKTAPTGGAKKTTSDGKKIDETRNIASIKPPVADNTAIARSAETFFRAGFREYTLGNFARAKTQFETVLQISPGHALGRLYLDNCNREIEEEIKFHMERGKKSREAGKLKEARGHYQAVKKRLDKDKTSNEFKEAEEQLEAVEKEMKDISTRGGDI